MLIVSFLRVQILGWHMHLYAFISGRFFSQEGKRWKPRSGYVRAAQKAALLWLLCIRLEHHTLLARTTSVVKGETCTWRQWLQGFSTPKMSLSNDHTPTNLLGSQSCMCRQINSWIKKFNKQFSCSSYLQCNALQIFTEQTIRSV